METPEYGIAAMRRGSYDDATAPLRPHLRNLAQRRRSAPSLVFGKALGMPWSPIREEASCWVAVEQSPFVLGLSSVNGELLLDECVQVTEGTKTRERHLFLFHDAIVFTKLKSTASYRLKHRVSLEDIWLYGFEDEVEDEEGMTGDIDLRVTIILAWDLTFCLVCFRTPEVKERWLDTLHRRIKDAKARAGCASSPPDVLMKVLSGNVATKTLTGVGMEQQVIVLDGNANISAVSKLSNHQEDKQTQPTETKWKEVVRKLKKGSSFINKTGRSAQLFGLPLCKICPDDCSLPKPVTEMLMLLRKNGPSTEGIFRKPCNSKNMRDIREQLNGGLEVDLKGQSVSLLVGLLKSFLKELPGCLLVSELYDVWMKAMDNEDTQQRVLEVRKVVDMLPRPNKLLLQHLLCVLYHILENADTNKMDAHNLAVCIAPTLLQLNSTPLDEQMEKTQKVTDLTQFLIEHFEILGDNIPNLLDTDEDSLSSQHHDSAYDSTDPEGDGEAGESTGCVQRECGSSSSLIPSITTSSWRSSDTTLNTKPEFNRRCSEPIILLSPELQDLCCHARSHDDCSVERRDFEEQPLKKQISDDSFLHRGQGNARLGLSFQKLSSSCNVDPRLYNANRVKDWSCSSLESTTSNQSEGSVFTSSPAVSPSFSRRADPANQTAGDAKAQQDFARPNSEEKRRSQSVRGPNKVIMRTRSLITFNRSSLKKDPQKEISFPCETLQEDSQSEADSPAEPLQKSRPLSAIEVFKHVDSRLPCRPPPYSQAVQNVSLPPVYNKSMTVQAAIELKRRSRPSSVNYDYTDYVPQAIQDKASVVNQPFRQRAMSESVSSSHRELLSRRCSQPVFEESSYPKESYV